MPKVAIFRSVDVYDGFDSSHKELLSVTREFEEISKEELDFLRREIKNLRYPYDDHNYIIVEQVSHEETMKTIGDFLKMVKKREEEAKKKAEADREKKQAAAMAKKIKTAEQRKKLFEELKKEFEK